MLASLFNYNIRTAFERIKSEGTIRDLKINLTANFKNDWTKKIREMIKQKEEKISKKFKSTVDFTRGYYLLERLVNYRLRGGMQAMQSNCRYRKLDAARKIKDKLVMARDRQMFRTLCAVEPKPKREKLDQTLLYVYASRLHRVLAKLICRRTSPFFVEYAEEAKSARTDSTRFTNKYRLHTEHSRGLRKHISCHRFVKTRPHHLITEEDEF